MSVSVNRRLPGTLSLKMTKQSGWHRQHCFFPTSMSINVWVIWTKKPWNIFFCSYNRLKHKFTLFFYSQYCCQFVVISAEWNTTWEGYQVSGCSVFKCEMSSKVICHMIRVATWQRCTYGADLEDRKRDMLISARFTAQHSLVGAGSSWTNTEIGTYLLYKCHVWSRRTVISEKLQLCVECIKTRDRFWMCDE